MSETRSTVRVVVVESQTLVQKALAMLINSIDGLQVVGTAATIDEGAAVAERLRPEVVLMSIAGEWGVFAAAQKINKRSPSTHVILLDERTLDANARETLRVGASGYLTKAQPDHQIENALRRAASGERVFAPEIAARLVLSADSVRLARDTSGSPLSKLTPREFDVLIHLAQGYTVKQCAKVLGIGTSTAGNHKSRLMKKLNVHKTVDLTRIAIREGVVPDGRGPIPARPVEELEKVR